MVIEIEADDPRYVLRLETGETVDTSEVKCGLVPTYAPGHVAPEPDDPFAGLTFNTNEGETFFEANEEGVFYRNEPLVTEERVREIFREEYYNVLREDLNNLG